MDIVEKLRKMSFACDHNRSTGDFSIAPKEYLALAALMTEAGAEIERLRKLEAPLLDWLDMQSSANSHALYCAAMEHFGRTPVLPD